MTIGGYAKFTRDVEVGGNFYKNGKGVRCAGMTTIYVLSESMIRRMTKMADDEAKAKVTILTSQLAAAGQLPTK
jgi:hypothetical protein